MGVSMANPSKYSPTYNFSNFQAYSPSTPLPGQQVDVQLADIATVTASLRAAVMDIRRSDGALQNNVVTADSLSPSLSIGFTNRGGWAEGATYSAGDGVTYDDTFYKARVQNTATSSNRPDLDTDTWMFLFTFSSIALTDGSVGPAKLESSQGEAFHEKLETAALLGALIAGLTSKSTPVDDDLLALSDSANGSSSKGLSWADLKATLKAYFDEIYWASVAASTSTAGILAVATDAEAVAQLVSNKLLVPSNLAALGIARLGVEDQVITGGARVTSKDLGTISSGTVTLDPGDRPLQHYTNNGAHTLAPGASGGSLMLDITNGASAGPITTSGFTKVVGSFDTTSGHKFRCHASIGNGGSLLTIQGLF